MSLSDRTGPLRRKVGVPYFAAVLERELFSIMATERREVFLPRSAKWGSRVSCVVAP
jgi:hypothetical protein